MAWAAAARTVLAVAAAARTPRPRCTSRHGLASLRRRPRVHNGTAAVQGEENMLVGSLRLPNRVLFVTLVNAAESRETERFSKSRRSGCGGSGGGAATTVGWRKRVSARTTAAHSVKCDQVHRLRSLMERH